MVEREYDVIVLGGGPAGLSALVWCHSLHLRALLIESGPQLGGQLHVMYHRVIDYPGLIAGSGAELADSFESHVTNLGLQYLLNVSIQGVALRRHQICIDGEWIRARALVLAMGARKTRLGVPGEDLYEGSGVSFTATRDHPLFAGLDVVVVGGGDSAFENALMLARVCPSVTLIHRTDTFRARKSWVREVTEHPRIKIRTNAVVRSIEGADRPQSVVIEDVNSGNRESIPAAGVFVRLGMTPNSELIKGELHLDAGGYIRVDASQQTDIEGVYSAGDICAPHLKSIAIAVGHGASAVKAIAAKLNATPPSH